MKTSIPYIAVVFSDRKREWRWNIIARNKRIVACSGEGYKRRGTCLRVLQKLLNAWVNIPISLRD